MVSAHRSGTTPGAAAIDRRTVLRALLISGVAATLPGCEGVSLSTTDPALTLPALAGRYVQLTQALALHQPSLIEAWLGAAPVPAGPRRPVAALRAGTTALATDLTTLAATSAAADAVNTAVGVGTTTAIPETARLRYLAGQARALDAAAARLLGESTTFAVQAERTFGHAAPPRDGAALDALRADLAALLPGPGSLAERHAAFRRAAAVPPERVDAVFAAAVEWCRRAAGQHLPLPAGETLTTRAEDTTGWAAFSRPAGPRASELWVARRGGADAAHLLQLAAHEGTPGHHAQHVLAAATLVDGRGWTERALHPGFGPHRLVAEGAAEAGAALLLPEDVRIRVLAEVLLPAAGQPPALAAPLARVERRAAALDLEVAYIAAEYLDTSLSVEATTTRLRDEALVLDPAGMVGFIEKQRTHLLAYPLGRRLVTAALGDGPATTRWARLATLATTLTLPAGVEE
jgi:hypothetical protein